MSLHPKLQKATDRLLLLGFTIYAYNGTEPGQDATWCTMLKQVNMPNVDMSHSIEIQLRVKENQVHAQVSCIIKLITIQSIEFTLPNPNAQRFLAMVQRAAFAATFELHGYRDRGYFGTVLEYLSSIAIKENFSPERKLQKIVRQIGLALHDIDTEEKVLSESLKGLSESALK